MVEWDKIRKEIRNIIAIVGGLFVVLVAVSSIAGMLVYFGIAVGFDLYGLSMLTLGFFAIIGWMIYVFVESKRTRSNNEKEKSTNSFDQYYIIRISLVVTVFAELLLVNAYMTSHTALASLDFTLLGGIFVLVIIAPLLLNELFKAGANADKK